MTAEDRLATFGVLLPSPAAPVANYLSFVVSGSLLLVVSGQLAFGPNGKLDPAHAGKLGAEISYSTGQAAARLCAINILAQDKAALGGLDRISRCIRPGGFINAAPGFAIGRRDERRLGLHGRGLGRQGPPRKIDGRCGRIALG